MKSKKAISGVVATVILIGLTILAITIVWVFVDRTITNQINKSEACYFGFEQKVEINNRYTCYNKSSNEFRFSLSIGDIKLDKVLVSISREGSTNTYEIENTTKEISGIINYPSRTSGVKIPGENSGLTYILTEVNSAPDEIKIAPIIKGFQCEVSDILNKIDPCF
jgi:hypothetical protein